MRAVLLPLALVSTLWAQAPAIPPAQPVEFQATDRVLQTDVPRFSMKLSEVEYRPWSSPPMFNTWMVWGNPEPAVMRYRLDATGGGPDWIESRFVRGSRGGLGDWDTYQDGWYDGAEVEVLRFEGGAARLLRRARVVRSVSGGADSENRLYLDQTGPEVREGDQFTVSLVRTEFPRTLVRQWGANPPWAAFTTTPQQDDPVVDTANAAPEGGSRGGLRFRIAAGEVTIAQPWLGTNPRWVRLRDAPYVLRVWLRGEGLGTVAVRAGNFAARTVEVDTTWRLVEIPFSGGPATSASERIEFVTTGPGTLWIDNLGVFDTTLEPFAVYPWVEDALRSLRASYLRIWPLQYNRGPAASLAGRIVGFWEADSRADERRIEGSATPGLHQLLELCAEVGSDPWITTSTQFTLEEHRQLIEYLAAPADVGLGALRARLGRPEPWTEAFDRILIELGNEVWNTMFQPQGFPGQPERYGAYAQLVFSEMREAHGFDAAKFDFVLDGWRADTTVRGYGQRAAAVAPLGAYVGYAPYLGGWDIGADLGAGGAQELLLYHAMMHRAGMADAVRSAVTIGEQRGAPLGNVLYESGPGYSLPNPEVPFVPEEQLRGKSLAAALGYVDQLLTNRALGFGPQAYFSFRAGPNWSSHATALHPHITTHAMTLLNTFAIGDLVELAASGVPTVDLPARTVTGPPHGRSTQRRTRNLVAQDDVPLVVAQAYRDGATWRFAAYSLRGEGATPVTIRLPSGHGTRLRASILTHADAMAHNIDADTVRPTPFTGVTVSPGVLQFTLPPASLLGIELAP